MRGVLIEHRRAAEDDVRKLRGIQHLLQVFLRQQAREAPQIPRLHQTGPLNSRAPKWHAQADLPGFRPLIIPLEDLHPRRERLQEPHIK